MEKFWTSFIPAKKATVPTFVGVCGYAGHGKDTIANYLVQEYSYRKIAFADKLKQMALVLDPIIGVGEFHLKTLAELVKEVGWDEAKKNLTVRTFLQKLGTEVGRQMIDDNLWVRLLLREATGSVIIPDVRFPNEYELIRDRHGLLIYVEDPRKLDLQNPVYKHVSEKHISYLKEKADVVLINNDTVESLYGLINSYFVNEFHHADETT